MGHLLSLSPLLCPTPPTSTSPIASVSPHLSVPSHSRPTRRPSRSMRPGRGFTGTGDPFQKGSSQSLPGSREDARKSKERAYPELLRSRRCRLVVLALETGGRWSPEATTFLRLLAQTKPRAVPNILRKAVEASLLSRWSAILTHAAQHAFAASLLDLDCAGTSILDGDTPSISQLLSEAPLPHRLPAVSQPAPKELRLGFGPALHAHPEPPV